MTTTSFYGVDVDVPVGGETAPTAEVLEIFDILKPRASMTPLIRIGGDQDGAYLVPDQLDGIAACFSPGVNKIKCFEDFLSDRYAIKSHMCDFSCDVGDFKTPLKIGMQTFLKKWLDVVPGEDNISLEQWIDAHAAEGDLLLQMDIEGAEYRNLLATPDETLARFRVIVIEVHGLRQMLDAAILRQVIAPFFTKLGRRFTCVHAHPNNCCGEFTVPGTDVRIPNVLELTFVRSDRFAPTPNAVLLPHPLDISRNLPRKPPLFLSDAWCDYDRPLASRVKIIEDTLDYRDAMGGFSAQSELSGVLAMTMQSLQTISARSATSEHPGDGVVEVASGRPYLLSSAYGRTSRVGVVQAHRNYFFHTDFGKDQFIRVDLGRSRVVRRIEVTNRRNGFQARAKFVFVALAETDEATITPNVYPMFAAGPLAIDAWMECGIDLPDVVARFITITSPINTALHFADLRIFAVSEASPPTVHASLSPSGAGAVVDGARRIARRIKARVRRSRRPRS
jgi:hypothetical protein